MSVTTAASPAVAVLDLPNHGTVIYTKKAKVSDPALKAELQTLADANGWTIRVTSGDRNTVPPGGSKTSQHLQKRGADFHVDGVSDDQVFETLRASDSLANGYQVIDHGIYSATTKIKKGHVHIGRFTDGRASEFKVEGLTKKTKGVYTSVGRIFPAPAPTPAPVFPINFTPVLVVSTTQLNFTATEGGPDPAAQSFLVANFGGGVLDFIAIGSDIVFAVPSKTSLVSGDVAAVGVSVSTSGLRAGVYDKVVEISAPSADHSPQFVGVHVVVQPKAPVSNNTNYSGAFSGTVTNDDAADNGNDPGSSFTDSYGGVVTMSVTPVAAGGFDLAFSTPNGLDTASSHGESFAANVSGVLHVASLGSFSFQVSMGDGKMVVKGQFVQGGVTGTWQFVQTDPDDKSDSGSGTFYLVPIA